MHPIVPGSDHQAEPSATDGFAWRHSQEGLQAPGVEPFPGPETALEELKRKLQQPGPTPEEWLGPETALQKLKRRLHGADRKTAPPPEPVAPRVAGHEARPVDPPEPDGVSAAGVPAEGPAKPFLRRRRLFAAAAVLAIAAGMFGAWRLREYLPIGPEVGAVLARPAAAPDSPVAPPAEPPVAASANPDVEGPPPVPDLSGRVIVRAGTVGARVWIDDVYRGRTPLSAEGILVGKRVVSVEGPAGRTRQEIDVQAGSTSTLFVSIGAAASGAIAVTAPAEIEVREGGRLLGTSRAERILFDPGSHTLDLVNEAVGYESRRVVTVVSGKTLPIVVEFPTGTLNINAIPWAEVLVDGQRVGDTPIGNLKVNVGAHQVTFRHPELGEVTRTVDVTLRGPARITVNLERKEP